MLLRNGDNVDVNNFNMDTTSDGDLAHLAQELGFSTEADSAAVLSALLDHYKREGSKSPEQRTSVLMNDNLSSTDVVCKVALNTATEWLSQSAERADALFQYDSFMNQVNEWTGDYKGERHLSPYVSGLQVLLRMCMNSERPAKAVLNTDTARGLARVMANGDSSACPGLAAAILSVCIIRSRSPPVLAQTSSIVIPAISEFFDNVLNRASNGNNHNGTSSTGVSPPGSEGASRATVRSTGGGGGNFSTLSGADADAFYMGGALLHLVLPHVSPGQSAVLEQVMLTVLEMLVRLLETPEHLEHLLPVSMALSLLGSTLKSSEKLQDTVINQGVVGKAVDVLSSISLAKTAVPHSTQRENSRAMSALSINLDDPHASEEHQLEAAVAVLRFLTDLIDAAPHCVDAVMACYPGIILRSLLQHSNPGLVQATAALVGRLALGSPDFQRYLRLEEVLVRLVPAMAASAEMLTHKGEDHDLLARADAIVQCCDALCALLNGSPDNHLAVSQSGSSARAVDVLSTLSAIPLNKHSVPVRLRVDDACDHLINLLSVFCRNITNRRILASPSSLDQLAAALQRCHNSSLLPTTTPPQPRNGSSNHQPTPSTPPSPAVNGTTAAVAGSYADGGAAAGMSTLAGAEGVRAGGSAVKHAMFILVSLVTVESHVARHLVELEAFMPMLFSLLDSGPQCPALDNTSVLLLVLIRECKINKTMLIKVGVPAIVRMLQHHRNPAVSATAVQALSGVLTLLTMSKTMLDLVLQLGGLKLVLELLAYVAHPTDNDDDVAERVLSIHEASCVLISYLCELSSKARQQISHSEGVIESLVGKVLLMSDAEIIHNAASAHSAIGGGAATFGADSSSLAAAGNNSSTAIGGAVGGAVAARAAVSQQEALVSMLGDLMKNVGPDNYVFQAAKQAMQSAQRRLPGGGDAWEDRDSHTRQLDDKTGELGIGGIDEEFGATGARGGSAPTIPLDTKLQLTLAAINTLFRLLHTIQDLSKLVWAVGGPALVRRIVLLASRMKDSFEEAATKILVVFFSHRHIQDAVREAGLLEEMVDLIDSDNHTTVLIATKALAVICRNSPLNQALAVDRGLLTKCITLLHRCEDTYTAKWVILVINALVYENPKAQSAILKKDAVPLMVRWLDAGPEQEVATAAARALAKAAKGNKAVQQAICDAGGIPGFAAMLNGKPGSLAVRAAAEALADLAKENPSGQDEIREVGAIPRLLELLRTCMDSSSLVVTVVKALSVLAHSNHANMETVFRLGGVPLLLEMLSPKIGPVSNAAAADLIRVLCSNELCQQNILRNQGLQALVRTLQTTTYTAAQSATVWAMNALVQGQKATLGLLLQPDTIGTLMRCITADNGAAPGTVRLLLVVFLHSGKHEELRQQLLAEPEVMVALLDMLKKGPAVEPTKWTASLLSTLCWQENSMKSVMIELRAPAVLAQVLEMAVAGLGCAGVASDTARTTVEATISTLQALISLIDESTPKSNMSLEPSRELQRLAVDCQCVRWIGRAGCECIPAVVRVHEALGTQRDTTQHLQKLLKPLLRALDWLLPHYATRSTSPPREAEELLSTVLSCDDSLKSAKRHADDLRREHYTDARAR